MNNKIVAINSVTKLMGRNSEITNFKSVMEQKRSGLQKNIEQQLAISTKPTKQIINNVVEDVVKNHEVALKSVNASLVRTDFSPEKLLSIQYKTGILFLREQMFCKTAELSANTFKSFTQMQV